MLKPDTDDDLKAEMIIHVEKLFVKLKVHVSYAYVVAQILIIL